MTSLAPTPTASLPLLNYWNPSCTYNECLQQVIGIYDGQPQRWYDECTSFFGGPVTSTYTVDSIVHEVTTTESYTVPDITFVTETETGTITTQLYTTVSGTATVTSTATVTETVTTDLPDITVILKDRHADPTPTKKKNRCKPHTSSAPVTSTPPSSAVVPPDFICTNLMYWSSVCSCIYAASDATTVVPVTVATSTGTITATLTTFLTTPTTFFSTQSVWVTVTEYITVTDFVETTTEVTTTTTTTTVTAGIPNIPYKARA